MYRADPLLGSDSFALCMTDCFCTQCHHPHHSQAVGANLDTDSDIIHIIHRLLVLNTNSAIIHIFYKLFSLDSAIIRIIHGLFDTVPSPTLLTGC